VWEANALARGSIPIHFITQVAQWRQLRWWQREAGGVILGFIDMDTKGLLAESITHPCRGDKRTRTGFFRGLGHHKKIRSWHAETGGRGTLIGLWHTHPEPDPQPSDTDMEDLSNALKRSTYHGSGLLYIIAGTEYLGCWYGDRGGATFKLGSIKFL
jgi:integrative and conjugative element protein (TIGR02256 family)